jgi:hypothetical protein
MIGLPAVTKKTQNPNMENSDLLKPRRPTNIPSYAETCLRALVANGLNDKISLGGAFGLLHYLDYRPTHDVDAWWDASATTQDKERVIQVIGAALSPRGRVQRRTWGDVVSIELVQADQTVFSFQIAFRSVQLQPSVSATWIDVALDSFPDVVASKMVALVERGAPRDFRDIHALCDADLTTPKQCWTLWRQRQRLAGSDTDSHRARLAIETHLIRITLHRPLDEISDPDQRAEAEQVRTWFREDFLDALVD